MKFTTFVCAVAAFLAVSASAVDITSMGLVDPESTDDHASMTGAARFGVADILADEEAEVTGGLKADATAAEKRAWNKKMNAEAAAAKKARATANAAAGVTSPTKKTKDRLSANGKTVVKGNSH